MSEMNLNHNEMKHVKKLTSEEIAEAAEGTPLTDEERAIHNVAQYQKDAHLLHQCLEKRERDGFGRSLPYPGWIQENIPLLQEENEKLVMMLIQNSKAIEMADQLFALLQARQEGKISGNTQDVEFGRLVAKKHFPSHTHADIDAHANEHLRKSAL